MSPDSLDAAGTNNAGMGELAAFVRTPSRLTVADAPPRAGKTHALATRASRLNVPTLWCSSGPADGELPSGSTRETLLCWVSRRYMELRRNELRVVDFEELRRSFGVHAAALPGDIAPWFEAYCAAKRIRARHPRAGVASIVARHGLRMAHGQESADLLAGVITDVDRALAITGMTTPWDAAAVVRGIIEHQPRKLGRLLDGIEHICVDDLQLLTTSELELILELARAGARVSATFGRWQCFNLRDGGVGLSYVSRLRASGFVWVATQHSVGLTPSQTDAMIRSAGLYHRPPFKGVGRRRFRLSYASHEEEDVGMTSIAAGIGDYPEWLEAGQCAVITPLPMLAEYVAGRLRESGVNVVLKGRRTLQGSAAYLLATAAATAIRHPDDLVAMRQLATIWLDQVEDFEAIAALAHTEGMTLAQAAANSCAAAQFEAMNQWLCDTADGLPEDVPKALEACPHWVASETSEDGLRLWIKEVGAAQCLTDWQARGWTRVAARSFDRHGLIQPHTPGAVSVLSVQDCAGATWTSVDLVGLSEGMMPAPALSEEMPLEAHVLMHVFSRAGELLRMHHLQKMNLGPNGKTVKLRPSLFAGNLGVDDAPTEKPTRTPGPRERFSP